MLLFIEHLNIDVLVCYASYDLHYLKVVVLNPAGSNNNNIAITTCIYGYNTSDNRTVTKCGGTSPCQRSLHRKKFCREGDNKIIKKIEW